MEKLELNIMRDRMLATKKELVAAGESEAARVMDEGWTDAPDLLVHGKRIITFVNAFIGGLDSEVRAKVDAYGGKHKVDGADLTLGSTGDRLNYKEDPIYADLAKQLKDREALLKMRFKAKNIFYDVEGIEVPLVSIASPSKETLKVAY